jgi:glycogen debranching enzyme
VSNIQLQPRHALVTAVDVCLRSDREPLEPTRDDFGAQQKRFEGPLAHWLASRPQFESDSPLLKGVLDKSIVDLAALRVSGEINGEPFVMPAAGLPWFMTLFGRDTLVTALQTLAVGPELTRGALHLLGEAQGKKVDDFRDEANRIIMAQLEAASFSGFRLPEAFAGFERSVSHFPVPYPTACSPQAWATGAPFVWLRVMLGAHVRDGAIHIDPQLPEEIGRIKVSRIPLLGTLWDVEAIGSKGVVRLSA